VTTDTVAVSGIAAGGDGVGRLDDGRAVFMPRTARGERVRLRAGSLRVHRHFARAEVAEIVEPAAARITPVCPHYAGDRCSGCQLQHVSYEAQLDAKRTIVGDALRRIGKLSVADPEITGATEHWRYRTTIDLAVKQRSGRPPIIGFHPYDRPGTVFPLVECHVADGRVMDLWRALEVRLHLLPHRLERLTLRLDRDGARHVIAQSAGEPWRTAAQLRAELSDDASVVCWWRPVDGAPRVVAGPATGFPPTAFEEVNPEMGPVVRRWAVDGLGDIRGVPSWDLYAGIGDTTLLLAEHGARVVSVDADEKASAWARRRADLAAFGPQVRCVAGRAEDVLPSLPAPRAVVATPPRSGLHWDVVLRLGGDPVPRFAYISGDPSTLARDLHRLSVNYQVRSVRAFDVFPQTAHVVTVVHLEADAA
jgi:23S rRNA (uracil1939-C5)-methyltransferase